VGAGVGVGAGGAGVTNGTPRCEDDLNVRRDFELQRYEYRVFATSGLQETPSQLNLWSIFAEEKPGFMLTLRTSEPRDCNFSERASKMEDVGV